MPQPAFNLHGSPSGKRFTGSSQYASWVGGKTNADALVNGLRTGSSVTLVTVSPNNTKSIAGFTAQTRMSSEEIARGHGYSPAFGRPDPVGADRRRGTLPNGKTRLVQGAVALRAEPTLSPVASR